MQPALRFERALEVPDGLVQSDHRLTAAALKLLEAWELGEDREAAYTVEECVRCMRQRYVDGGLDRFILGLDANMREVLVADVGEAMEAPLGARLGHPWHPETDVVKRTVAAVLDQLQEYVRAHPVDVD